MVRVQAAVTISTKDLFELDKTVSSALVLTAGIGTPTEMLFNTF